MASRKIKIRHTYEARTTEKVSFGLVDARGRDVGAVIERVPATVSAYVAGEQACFYNSELPDGECFGVRCEAARGGISYGATQHMKHFASEAEREAYVQKYLDDARRRAANKWKETR